MQPSSSLPNAQQCHVCHRALLPRALFCSGCGARVEETPAETLRGVNYLLGELARWESAGVITREQAVTLRERYEHYRSNLRAQIAPSNGEHEARDQQPNTVTETFVDKLSQTPPLHSTQEHAASPETENASAQAEGASSQYHSFAQASTGSRSAGPEIQPDKASSPEREPRTLLETLTDPHNLRLLLYTGAAMIVVSVVLWLRDVLYLKLQEPVVQAGLLAIATLAFMASGWYAILRTRQRLTGRALTLVGSLLVPINFWFLVRSGLIENSGRAWIVCAFCTILYAHTAALLREKLYVYLAAAGSIATAWALVLRAERDAFGLYALTLMLAAQVFLHLSTLFPLEAEAQPAKTDDERRAMENEGRGVEDERRAATDDASGVHRHSSVNGPLFKAGRWSYELWSVPLIRVGLVCAALSALLYMPLRLGPTLSLYDGLFHLTTNRYDASIAILLFAAWAYALWFTGRFIYTERRVLTLTLCVLALCWALILALDGLRLRDSTNLLALSLMTLAIALWHRIARDEENSRAFYQAGIIVSVLLIPLALIVFFNAGALTMKHFASGALLAASFALLSAPRFNGKFGQFVLATLSALFASAAFVIALASAHLNAETIYAACAAWPFALYLGAQMMRLRRIETQLVWPFALTADVLFCLMLVWSAILAAFIHLDQQQVESWRVPLWGVLLAASLYGVLRAARDNSIFGAGFASLALLVLVASFSDGLKQLGVLPSNLPIAALVICAAFLLPKARALWLPTPPEKTSDKELSLETIVRLVSDLSVILCGLLWLARAFDSIERGGFGAACVLLLALLYWSERAARGRQAWMADIGFISASAFLFALLVALRVDTRWYTLAFALVLPTIFFALGQTAARARGLSWLEHHAHGAAWVAATLAFVAGLLQASPHLRTGDALLLAPCLTTGVLALQAFAASLLITGPARVKYFRAGLLTAIISFSLTCLRAGFDPGADLEIYTSPVAVALLLVAYLSLRREWEEYERDTNVMLWLGSLMLCAPLLFHALEFRLLWNVPATGRDLGVLCASLALILFGVLGRLRAPVSIGIVTLLTELLVLTVTSVEWTQVPLKVYLGTVGSLLMIAGWMLGFRREQLINMRNRLHQQREHIQERFGGWR